MRKAIQSCDRQMVETFNYSALSSEFERLSKPAKRALINNGIREPKDLAKWTLSDVAKLHGIGPSAIPILKAALRNHKLKFKS